MAVLFIFISLLLVESSEASSPRRQGRRWHTQLSSYVANPSSDNTLSLFPGCRVTTRAHWSSWLFLLPEVSVSITVPCVNWTKIIFQIVHHKEGYSGKENKTMTEIWEHKPSGQPSMCKRQQSLETAPLYTPPQEVRTIKFKSKSGLESTGEAQLQP